MKRLLCCLILTLFPAFPRAVRAQQPQGQPEARTALVVGCDYKGTSLELPSPVQDARAVAAALENQLGFDVTFFSNPDRREFLNGIDRFGDQLKRRGGVGLFYFSGHGAQHEGENYLLPNRTTLGFREDLPSEAVTAQRVVTRMEAAGNGLNLLFLDACRNNELPSSRQKGALAKGLAQMGTAQGVLIGYATAPGTTALDGGTGSLYTNALLRHLAAPGLSVTDMLTRVNAEVRRVSKGKQIPFMEVGLSDVFAFVPKNTTSPAPSPAPTPVRRSIPMPPEPEPTVTPSPARRGALADCVRRAISEASRNFDGLKSGRGERESDGTTYWDSNLVPSDAVDASVYNGRGEEETYWRCTLITSSRKGEAMARFRRAEEELRRALDAKWLFRSRTTSHGEPWVEAENGSNQSVRLTMRSYENEHRVNVTVIKSAIQ